MKRVIIFLLITLSLVNSLNLIIAESDNEREGYLGGRPEFCGSSTKGYCQTSSECKKGGCSSQVCESITESTITTCEYLDCYNAEKYNKKCGCEENKCQWISDERENDKSGEQKRFRNLTKEQLKEAIQEKNRIKFEERTGQKCLDGCVCTGVVMKCELEDGKRQMTVYARSGNVIIQTKGINASTQVTLYKADKTLVGVFKNNITKQIKMTPEQAQEKIKEKLKVKIEKMNITLQDDGLYHIEIGKKARLFFLFPVREKTRAQINVEDGEVVKIRNPWWGFLARDIKEDIVGLNCGTVTPGMNDECCQNKGYNSYDFKKGECVFD